MTENIIIISVILCIVCAAGIYIVRKRKKAAVPAVPALEAVIPKNAVNNK